MGYAFREHYNRREPTQRGPHDARLLSTYWADQGRAASGHSQEQALYLQVILGLLAGIDGPDATLSTMTDYHLMVRANSSLRETLLIMLLLET